MMDAETKLERALAWADSRRIGIVGGPEGALEKISIIAAAYRDLAAAISRSAAPAAEPHGYICEGRFYSIQANTEANNWPEQYGYPVYRPALAAKPVAGEPVFVIFDGPPSHKSGRFVEVETADGRSVGAGRGFEWSQYEDFWKLGPFYAHPPAAAPSPDKEPT
jgi:hypothetical protein